MVSKFIEGFVTDAIWYFHIFCIKLRRIIKLFKMDRPNFFPSYLNLIIFQTAFLRYSR